MGICRVWPCVFFQKIPFKGDVIMIEIYLKNREIWIFLSVAWKTSYFFQKNLHDLKSNDHGTKDQKMFF